MSATISATAVLVVDGTGRGHAICELFIRNNPSVTVFYGPGCDVITHPRIVAVPSISLADVDTALAFLAENPVEFVFVSNIDALSTGYVDTLREAGHTVIGPIAAAAELEASKARGKRFCVTHGIPVPEFGVFTSADEAKRHIRELPYQCVVKIDGLTPDGDGSVVCDSVAEAEATVDRFAEQHGDDLRLVVEQRLTGYEVSVFALLDGSNAVLFPLAMDYKRTLEGDSGKNCDGMGSVAPHPAAGPELTERVRRELLDPLVNGLRAENLDFTGFVYLGAVVTEHGPVVIEINARFGDSEAQVVLPGVGNDFVALCRAVLAGELDRHELVTDGQARCSVALVQGCVDPIDPQAAVGWPFGEFTTGQQVSGLTAVDRREVTLYYANLRRGPDGAPTTCGGRVLHVVGVASTLAGARERAYRQIPLISFAGMRYRTDIAADADGGAATWPSSALTSAPILSGGSAA